MNFSFDNELNELNELQNMKKTLLFVLMALLSVTAGAETLKFKVDGISYETLGDVKDNPTTVKVVTDAYVKYSGDVVIPATVSYGGKTYQVTNIGAQAFWECTDLRSVVLPEGLTTIENSSFTGCTGLKAITLPSTLMWIRGTMDSYSRGAFENCTGLKSIYFPATMTYPGAWSSNIGDGAFRGCTGLKTIYLAGSETVIGYYDAFSGCTGASEVVISNPAPYNDPVVARVFEGMLSTTCLVVPDGAGNSFKNNGNWGQFQHIYERSTYSKVFAVLTAGMGGSISYSGETFTRGTEVFGIGRSQSVGVTITPDEGHKLLRLLKDGQDVTAQVSNGQYTVQSVQQDFTLEAIFEEGSTPQPGTGGTAKLSIEPFTIQPGETATMLIDMTNPDDEITALDFFMQLPQGLSIAMEDGEPAVDIAGRTTWKKHTLTVNTTDGHIMLYSATNATVSGTSGALISVKLQASSTFAGGDIVLKDQTLNTADVPLPVVSKPADYVYTITLDEPKPQITMNAEILNAIDGVVYENMAYVRVTAETEDEDKLNLFYYIYKIADNGEQERFGGMSGSFFLSSEGERVLGGDGHYKVEYGCITAKGKEVVLGSTPFECRIDDRYITIVMRDKMRTFSHELDLNFANTKGLNAYTAGGFNTSTNEALMMRVIDVPAETGLLLVGQPGVYLVEKGTSSTVYVNMLKAIVKSTKIDRMEGNYFNYVFRDGEEGLGFYLANNGTSINANSAVLQLRMGVAGNLPIVKMIFDDTNDISDIPTDGQPFDVYSLGGLLVKRGITSLKELSRGVYIVNGHKVVVK